MNHGAQICSDGPGLIIANPHILHQPLEAPLNVSIAAAGNAYQQDQPVALGSWYKQDDDPGMSANNGQILRVCSMYPITYRYNIQKQ